MHTHTHTLTHTHTHTRTHTHTHMYTHMYRGLHTDACAHKHPSRSRLVSAPAPRASHTTAKAAPPSSSDGPAWSDTLWHAQRDQHTQHDQYTHLHQHSSKASLLKQPHTARDVTSAAAGTGARAPYQPAALLTALSPAAAAAPSAQLAASQQGQPTIPPQQQGQQQQWHPTSALAPATNQPPAVPAPPPPPPPDPYLTVAASSARNNIKLPDALLPASQNCAAMAATRAAGATGTKTTAMPGASEAAATAVAGAAGARATTGAAAVAPQLPSSQLEYLPTTLVHPNQEPRPSLPLAPFPAAAAAAAAALPAQPAPVLPPPPPPQLTPTTTAAAPAAPPATQSTAAPSHETDVAVRPSKVVAPLIWQAQGHNSTTATASPYAHTTSTDNRGSSNRACSPGNTANVDRDDSNRAYNHTVHGPPDSQGLAHSISNHPPPTTARQSSSKLIPRDQPSTANHAPHPTSLLSDHPPPHTASRSSSSSSRLTGDRPSSAGNCHQQRPRSINGLEFPIGSLSARDPSSNGGGPHGGMRSQGSSRRCVATPQAQLEAEAWARTHAEAQRSAARKEARRCERALSMHSLKYAHAWSQKS